MVGSFDNNNMCINRNVCNDIKGMGLNLKTITILNSPYFVQQDDNVIFADATGGQVDVNLLKGLKYSFPVFMIKKLDLSANVVRILPGDVGTTVESSISYDIDQPEEVAEFIFDKPNLDWKLLTHDLDIGLNIMTTKGDILTHNGTTLAVLSVGTNGQVLSADSTQSTGLKWVTVGGITPHKIEYPLLITTVTAILSAVWTTVGNFPWLDSEYSSYTSGKAILRANIGNRNLNVRIQDVTNSVTLGSLLGISSTGSYSFSVSNPTSDSELQLQVQKAAAGGTSPILVGFILEFSL